MRRLALLAVAVLALAGAQSAAAASARWKPALAVPGVVDVTSERADGQLVVAAGGRLSLVRGLSLIPFERGPAPALTPFARGTGGYSTATGEPYIAVSPGLEVPGTGCRFPRGAIYAIEPSATPAVIRISRRGKAKTVARLPAGSFPNGIAFDDDVGRFGFRLLVTATRSGASSVFAIDCRGRLRTITTTAPVVEGGIAVAPSNSGWLTGRLIAPDELSGSIIAIDAAGKVRTVAKSGLPAGGDIGVESLGFVPLAPFANEVALLADRGGQALPHPGSDAILWVSAFDLMRAGAQPGDLLAATEGGATTIAVHCERSCTVRKVAVGPSIAHAEGHIVFFGTGSG